VNGCYFLDNPSNLLSSEISVCGLAIPINSEKLTNCSHLGLERLVQARCRICPYNFECECTYPEKISEGKTMRLWDWILFSLKEPIETALNRVKSKIGSIIPEWLAILVICPFQANLENCEALIGTVVREMNMENEKISVRFLFTEIEEINVLICIWTIATDLQ
jgi:hypothetical protein